MSKCYCFNSFRYFPQLVRLVCRGCLSYVHDFLVLQQVYPNPIRMRIRIANACNIRQKDFVVIVENCLNRFVYLLEWHENGVQQRERNRLLDFRSGALNRQIEINTNNSAISV